MRNLLEKDGLFKLSKDEIDTICTLTEGSSYITKFRTKFLPSLCYLGLNAQCPSDFLYEFLLENVHFQDTQVQT